MVAGHWYTAYYMCMNGLISEALQLTTLTLFWVLLSRSQMSIACTAPSQVEIVLCRLSTYVIRMQTSRGNSSVVIRNASGTKPVLRKI